MRCLKNVKIVGNRYWVHLEINYSYLSTSKTTCLGRDLNLRPPAWQVVTLAKSYQDSLQIYSVPLQKR
jgi:hypothetical protein